MMAEIVWLSDAQDDLKRLSDFIASQSVPAAKKAVQEILRGVKQLEDFPELGRPWEQDHQFRELVIPFGARGYIVRYIVEANKVVIIRVWHGLEDRR